MVENDFMSVLVDGAARLGIEIGATQAECFEKYFKMLVEWNRVMNLTAITDPEDVIKKHFLDSIAAACFIPADLLAKSKVIDIGTGAGFPGIPLKILSPGMGITLLDSLNKRISFLKSVSGELELENINFVHGRAEDLARQADHREMYDFAFSRAVAELSVLLELSLPFVKIGGLFVAYKSEKTGEEIGLASAALEILGGMVERCENVVIPGLPDVRTLVFIRKIRKTPDKYPRKAGMPSKKPLR